MVKTYSVHPVKAITMLRYVDADRYRKDDRYKNDILKRLGYNLVDEILEHSTSAIRVEEYEVTDIRDRFPTLNLRATIDFLPGPKEE